MKAYSKWNLLAPLICLATASFALNAVAQEAAASPDKKDATVKLEDFVVTGSHISGIDMAGLNPVVGISRADLALGGFSTVGDALRSQAIVSGSSLFPAGSNNSFTPGASTANLRGLGNNDVLVLLNGRRAAPLSSPGFNGLQTVFDFNSIPTAAVESIEILKDGGSAIYGSDAVSGVINIKLRQSYSGLSTSFGLGNTINTDSLEKKFALTYGATQGANSILFTLDWTQRAKLKDRDYAFSANANMTDRGGSDRRSYANYPALVYVLGLDDYYTLSAPKQNPALGDFQVADVSHGYFNFQSVTDQTPATRNYGFYMRAQHDFNPNLNLFTEVAFRRQESQIEAAPSPVFNYNEHGDGPTTGYLNIPANNPNNPFGENIEDEWYARLMSAGNRINDVVSDTPRVLIGLAGKFPNSGWDWETAALYTRNDVTNRNGGSVFDNLYQNALNGVVIGGTKLYANPFGPEDPAITAYYTHDNPTKASFELRTYDFKTSGNTIQLPAGPLSVAIGGDIRFEKLANIQTVDNITGNIIGGAEGNSTFGDRKVTSFYVEAHVPILKGLQLQAAGRYEKYSDFGSTTKPKIALSYRATDWLLFRGSYGQSFLAPNLAYLHTSQVTTFSDSQLDDPKRPNDAPRQIQTRGGGNPNLQPELTDSYYFGVQIEPTKGALKGWALTLDGFEFKQTGLIAQLGDDFILAHEDTFPGLVVRNPPTAGQTVGVINYIVDTYQNIDTQTYKGVDVALRYDWKTASVGTFRFTADSTYLHSLTYNDSETAGTYSAPRFRSNFTTDWRRKNWSAAVLVSYLGRYANYNGKGNIAAQIVVNPQITYSGFYHTDITVGARNVFDRDPPLDLHSSTAYNNNINDPEKTFVYLRVSKDF